MAGAATTARVRATARTLLSGARPRDGSPPPLRWPDEPRLIADGWLRFGLPDSTDGGGLGVIEQCALQEELGAALAGAQVLVRAGFVLPTLAACSGEEAGELVGRVLAGMSTAAYLDGRRVGVVAEPRLGGGMELYGRAEAVAEAGYADELVVVCDIFGCPGVVVVACPAPGVTVERREVPDPTIEVSRVILHRAAGRRLPVLAPDELEAAGILGTVLHAARVLGGAASVAGLPTGAETAAEDVIAVRAAVHGAARIAEAGPAAESNRMAARVLADSVSLYERVTAVHSRPIAAPTVDAHRRRSVVDSGLARAAG